MVGLLLRLFWRALLRYPVSSTDSVPKHTVTCVYGVTARERVILGFVVCYWIFLHGSCTFLRSEMENVLSEFMKVISKVQREC